MRNYSDFGIVPQIGGDAGIPVSRAASRLGLSPRRVRAMIKDDGLAAEKAGGIWIVDPQSVERRHRVARRSGRPFDAKNAWALLWLASSDSELEEMASEWVSPWMRWYLLDKVKKEGWVSIAPRLHKRAAVERLRCHPSDLERLATDGSIVRSGVSAARDHGLDIFDPDVLEAYVPAGRLPGLVKKYALAPSDRPNVILHVVEDRWPFPRTLKVAPGLLAALDLLDAGDGRSRRAATAVLDRWNVA